MFKFFGSKYRLARNYPAPKYATVIEPFAGSAAYSVFHRRSLDRVVLVEKDHRIADVLVRLLSMSSDDIRALPDPVEGDMSSDALVAFAAGRTTRDTPERFVVSPRMAQRFRPMVNRIADVVDECRHFEVTHGDYTEAVILADEPATWFVDPPYQHQGGRWDRTRGGRYRHSNRDIDFEALGQWCDDLVADHNHIIACDMDGSTWREWNGGAHAVAGDDSTWPKEQQ